MSSVSNGFANGTAAGDTIIRGNSSGKLHFATSTSIRMSIASGGDTTLYGSNVSLAIGTLYIPDSLVHNGDNDTKIRFPSNDTITFETAGSEKLRIDSAGRCIVGGGTHAGGSALVVKGGNQNTYSTIGMFSNHTNPAVNTLLTQIRFGSNTSAVGADIRATADAAWGTNDYPTRLSFYTTPDGSNSRSERLRITKDGQIRIDQATSANNGIRMRPSGWNYDFRFGAVSSSGGSIWLGQNYEPTGGTRDSNTYGTNYLRFTTQGEILLGTGATDTNPTERMKIKSDGKVLIGGTLGLGGATSSPSGLLHAQTSSGEAEVKILGATNGVIQLSGYAGNSTINFGDSSSDTPGRLQYNHGSDSFHIRTGSNNRLHIMGNGDYGFNDSSPTANASGNDTVLSIKGKGSSYSGKIDFKDSDGNLDSYINSDNATLQIYCDPNSQNGNTVMTFSVHGSNRMRIGAGGDVDVETGDIFFSTAGKGIVLGNTSNTDANTLDDYEEGTFTPVMKFGGGNTGMSLGNVEAVYTKIGRMVYATIRFTMSGKGSSTGQLTFEGLPHTVGDVLSTTSVQGGFDLQYLQGNVNAHEIKVYPWESTSTLKAFKRSNQNSTTSDFTDSDISGQFDGRISFFYTADN